MPLASLVSGIFDMAGAGVDHVLNRDMTESANASNQHYSRRAIRDRVADAKKAGIHPLYALGAQTSTPQAQMVGSGFGDAISRTGQNIGGAINRAMDSQAKRRAILENRLLEQEIMKTNAEERLLDQEFILKMQRRDTGGGVPGLIDEGEDGLTVPGQQDSGLYKAEPPKRSTNPRGQPELESGRTPSMQEYILPGGMPMMLPASDEGLSEVFENIPFWMWPGLISMNKKIYGKQHTKDLWRLIAPSGEMPSRKQWKRNLKGGDPIREKEQYDRDYQNPMNIWRRLKRGGG